jgi:hypothetical protein
LKQTWQNRPVQTEKRVEYRIGRYELRDMLRGAIEAVIRERHGSDRVVVTMPPIDLPEDYHVVATEQLL